MHLEFSAFAKRSQHLQVGLHLTLVQGRAVLSPQEIPDLVDATGNFSDNSVTCGFRYFFDRGLYCQLKREIDAQITRVLDTGIPLSHIDGHLNIHLHPTVFRILSELMPRYGITSFRLAHERLSSNLRFDRQRIVGKTLESLIFGSLTTRARPELDRLGIRYASEVKGVLNSGQMTEEYLLGVLADMHDGLTEIYFHPGIVPDAEINHRMPDYRHQEELAALVSPKIRQRLQELLIRVENYRGEVKC